MPTTLSSGVILVGQASGNIALALLLTVITNLVGVFTVPFMVTAVLSSAKDIGGQQGQDITLEPSKMVVKLIFTILIPLCVGKWGQRDGSHLNSTNCH